MIDLFKNVFWYIIEGACTVLLHMLKYVAGFQEVYDEAVARRQSSLTEIYLIRIKAKGMDIEPAFYHLHQTTLKSMRCVKKQLKNIYGY